jgi:hypothetical protein
MHNARHFEPQRPLPAAPARSVLQRIPKSLVLVALVLLAPWLLPGYFATAVNFDHCWVKQSPRTGAANGFTLTRLETQGGTNVPDGGRFCDGADVPLRLSGTTTLPDDARLWLVLVGDQGQYYLHGPSGQISSGAWHIDSYRPGRDNRAMLLLKVGESTHRDFLQRGIDRNWAAFSTLPADAQELARVALDPVPICGHFDARHCVR